MLQSDVVVIQRPSHLPFVTSSKEDAGSMGGGGGASGGSGGGPGGEGGLGGGGGAGGSRGGEGGAFTQQRHVYEDEQLPVLSPWLSHTPSLSLSQYGGISPVASTTLMWTAVVDDTPSTRAASPHSAAPMIHLPSQRPLVTCSTEERGRSGGSGGAGGGGDGSGGYGEWGG